MTGQVTTLPRPRKNPEMNRFGVLIAAPLVVLALPLLPFIAVLWGYWRVTESSDRTHDHD